MVGSKKPDRDAMWYVPSLSIWSMSSSFVPTPMPSWWSVPRELSWVQITYELWLWANRLEFQSNLFKLHNWWCLIWFTADSAQSQKSVGHEVRISIIISNVVQSSLYNLTETNLTMVTCFYSPTVTTTLMWIVMLVDLISPTLVS